MKKGTKVGMLVSFVVLSFILLSLVISNTALTISQYFVEYENLPDAFDGYKIVQLSDLHSKQFGKNNKNLLKKIQTLKPDLVVMTGDMINTTDNNYDDFVSISQRLASEYPTYYVIGNHEQNLSQSKLQALYQSLSEAGVFISGNTKMSIQKQRQSIDIYGLWFNLRYYSDQRNEYIQKHADDYFFGMDKMNEVLGSKDSDSFCILLTHNPLYFESYAAWGADLVLAGHMHGGMIRLPFIGGLFSPEKVFLPKYDSGKFSFEGTDMIISKGLGNGNIGFRLWNCPDLVSVTLKVKGADK